MRAAAVGVIALALGAGLALQVAVAAPPVVDLVEQRVALVSAARANDAAAVRVLLDAKPGPDVNEKSADGTTALHWAAYNDNLELVERLIKAGANVDTRNEFGSSPMSEAAVRGSVPVMKRLLDVGADVESANADGQTALMIVARTSNVDAAKLLLRKGARVNARERWREQTPLMWAAAEAQPAMVKLLIDNRAQVDARSRENVWDRQVTAEPRMQARPAGAFTPLLFAARRGCAECASLLLKAGADVNLADPDGVTPLLLATINLNFDTAAILVKHGADLDKWDTWGRSALYSAVDMNTLPTGGRADRPSLDRTTALELVAMLLEAGANPNLQLKLFPPYRSLRDDRGADGLLSVGTTPLLRAAKAGDLPAMKLLLAHGALVDLPTARGITPLMAAAGNGSLGLDTRGRYKSEAQSVEAVELLLASGANANARDRSGQTALHGAAGWGHNGVVKALAAHKIDLFVKDAQGRTAADVARGTATSSGRSGGGRAFPQTEALLRELMNNGTAPVTGG